MSDYRNSINQEKALIWRITHIHNLEWILDSGLYSGNSDKKSKNWISIDNQTIIERRNKIRVPLTPYGVLNDYISFYFTPFSPMMLNIHHGRGVKQQENEDIIILVSSLNILTKMKIPFVFTDGHACYSWSNFYSKLEDLDKINWTILQNRDFKRDQDNPKKFEQYQAEALIYQSCPIEAIIGIICFNEKIKKYIENELSIRNLEQIKVFARKNWYFE